MKNKLRSVKKRSIFAATSQATTPLLGKQVSPVVAPHPTPEAKTQTQFQPSKEAFVWRAATLEAQPFYPALPARESGINTAHDALEIAVPHVLAAIETLSDAYWNAIDQQNEHQRRIANGLTGLAYGAACRLEVEFPLAVKEWKAATKTAQPTSAAPSPSRASGDDVTLVINLPDGTEFARFDLPRAVLELVEEAATKAHRSLPEFITRAIKNKIRRDSAANSRRGSK